MSAYRAVQLCLAVTGVLGTSGFVILFVPWDWIAGMFAFFGLGSLPDAPVIRYMIRVVCALAGFAGLYCLVLARSPLQYPTLLLLTVAGLLGMGVVMLAAGALTRVPSYWYLIDPLYCVLAGVLLAVLWKKAAR